MEECRYHMLRSVVFGHAVADALGVPVEFHDRAALTVSPVSNMRGYGTHPVPAGAWSDDTTMALCALDVLADNVLDYDRIMRNFCKWYYEGAFTPTGVMFDIGRTCTLAIKAYHAGKRPAVKCGLADERDNGNGSLMRIYPFVLYLAEKDLSVDKKLEVIQDASALTHAHERSKIGCGLYALILWQLLRDRDKKAVDTALTHCRSFYRTVPESQAYARILSGNLAHLSADGIRSSGYIVDTLEAALWSLLTTDSYEACVLRAVNLGEDTDTVAAVAGSLAGALYGYQAIPQTWRDGLLRGDFLDEMCRRAAANWNMP